MKASAYALSVICLLPMQAFASPPANDWHAEFRASAREHFVVPGEALTLTFSAPLAPEQRARLSLELDDIDVSDMIEWHGEGLSYQPVRSLESGLHQLRLVYYGQDGSVMELGHWRFDVRHSQHLKQLSLEGNTELSAQQRMYEHNMGMGDDVNATGASQWRGELVTDALTLQGETDFEYAHRAGQSSTGQHLDMTRLWLLAETDTTRITAGDQRMGNRSLLMEGYQQRGMSGDLTFANINSDLKLFSMRGTRALGWQEGIGLENADNRITGGRWQTYWSPGDSSELLFSASYIGGRTEGSSAGSWPPSSTSRVHEGQAWNAIMDGFFMDRALRLRLEHATSTYDFDGRRFGFEAVEDTAWSGLVTLTPQVSATDTPISWHIGAETQQVGAFYRSLANPDLANDVNMHRLFLAAERENWFLDTSYTLEQDNLDNNPLYPTSETQRWLAQIGYSDIDTPAPGSLYEILGQPSYTVSLDRTRHHDLDTPSGYSPEDITTQGVRISAAFHQPRWNWAVEAGIEQLSDHTGWQPDTQQQHLGGQFGLALNERYQLTAGLQSTRTRYRNSGERIHQQLYHLGASAELIPHRLAARFDVNFNRFNAEDDPFFAQHQVNRYASGQLVWTLREARTNRAGISLSLSYSGNQLKDRLSNRPTLNEEQLWLKLQTTLPSSYPSVRP